MFNTPYIILNISKFLKILSFKLWDKSSGSLYIKLFILDILFRFTSNE